MRKYGWFAGLVLTFFGALPGIQLFVQLVYLRRMTINSWALIVGGLILCWMIIKDINSTRKNRNQEISQIQSTIGSIESELARESEARRYADESQLSPMIQKLAQRIVKLEDKK